MKYRIPYFVATVFSAVVMLAGGITAADETAAPASDPVRGAPFFNWALVRVLDPYGNPLAGAGVWVNPRSSAPVRQLKELSNGWYITGRVRRGITDVTALHDDYTLESVLPLFFSPTKPFAIGFARMLENDAALEGFVTDATNDQPIHPAHVTVLRAPPDTMGMLYGATFGNMTEESGHFYYPMASGFYDGLYVSAEGYESFLVQPYNAPAGLSNLNFTLNPVVPGSAEAEPPEGIRIEIMTR